MNGHLTRCPKGAIEKDAKSRLYSAVPLSVVSRTAPNALRLLREVVADIETSGLSAWTELELTAARLIVGSIFKQLASAR